MSAWLPLSTRTLCRSQPATLQLITMVSMWGALRRSTSRASKVSGTWDHDWTGDGDMVDAAVVVPLLPLRVEVGAGPPSDHMNDSAIRLISEVLLLWGMGVVDVLLLLVWRWGWGRYDLYFLVVLVCVVRGMRSGGVDVWRRGLLICVRDNSRVVGWLCLCHPVSGGLRLWAVSGLVGAVFVVE
jgi:hypothetical protein